MHTLQCKRLEKWMFVTHLILTRLFLGIMRHTKRYTILSLFEIHYFEIFSLSGYRWNFIFSGTTVSNGRITCRNGPWQDWYRNRWIYSTSYELCTPATFVWNCAWFWPIGRVAKLILLGLWSIILAPCCFVKPRQLIPRSGTRRWNLRVANLQMSCSYLKWKIGHKGHSHTLFCSYSIGFGHLPCTNHVIHLHVHNSEKHNGDRSRPYYRVESTFKPYAAKMRNLILHFKTVKFDLQSCIILWHFLYVSPAGLFYCIKKVSSWSVLLWFYNQVLMGYGGTLTHIFQGCFLGTSPIAVKQPRVLCVKSRLPNHIKTQQNAKCVLFPQNILYASSSVFLVHNSRRRMSS